MAKIELTDVSITFNSYQQKRMSLKEYVIHKVLRKSVNPVLRVHALTGVNLSARDGERIGIIGHNGAGKTTLLKTLAGVYPPTTGTRVVEGKICSLFDITLGFEYEATGWENILYRAYLQGETPSSIRGKIDSIAEFTELGEFLNIAVRNYSAGMAMRLAFSIATAVDPEVLLIDEVLAVGDMAFLKKARDRMRELMKTSRLMVMVAHDLPTIREMCTRVLWMTHGQITMEGKPDEVVAAYTAAVAGASGTDGLRLPRRDRGFTVRVLFNGVTLLKPKTGIAHAAANLHASLQTHFPSDTFWLYPGERVARFARRLLQIAGQAIRGAAGQHSPRSPAASRSCGVSSDRSRGWAIGRMSRPPPGLAASTCITNRTLSLSAQTCRSS